MTRSLGLDHIDWQRFDERFETARVNCVIAAAVRAADHLLHTIFVSGDEPRWLHESQRNALIELRAALVPLAAHIGVLDPVRDARMTEILKPATPAHPTPEKAA